MVNITLLELHVDDANATFSTGGSDGEEETSVVAGEPDADEADGGSGPPVAAAVVGLVFALAVALLVKKFVLGGAEEQPDL